MTKEELKKKLESFENEVHDIWNDNITKQKFMKCIKCEKEIPSYWYYKNDKKLCGDYTYIGYCATCEDFARYTGNL